jgi:hypothetical protein
MSKSQTTRRLGLESMESRQLMAGNVFAAVGGGDLFLSGDGAANGVEVRQLGAGKYQIIGLVHGGVQTKVWLGGVGANSQVVAGVTDDFQINLNAGDDALLMSAAGLPAGSKLLVPTDLNIHTHDGNDRVVISNVRARDDVFIDLGNHNDYLSMYGTLVGGSPITPDNDLAVHGGTGNDFAIVQATSIRDDLIVNLVDGNDTAYLNKVSVGDDALIYTGNGDDRVQAMSLSVRGDLVMDMSAGKDVAHFNYVTANTLYAHMGSGDDYLWIANSHSTQTTLNGGLGFADNLDFGPGNVLGGLAISNFEF